MSTDVLTGDVTPPANQPPVEPPANEAPPAHAPEWLSGIEGLDADIAGDPSLAPIKDIPNLIKSFVNAQKMMGKDKAIIPTKDSSADDWNAFYNKIGKPSSMEEYDIGMDEEIAKKQDQTILEGYKQIAFENNLLPQQAKAVMEWVTQQEEALDQKYMEDVTAKKQAEFDALKTEWGDTWDSKVNVAKTALSEYGDEAFTEWVRETGLGGTPQMIKFLEKVGQSLTTEDKPGGGAPKNSYNLTPDEAQKQINEAMSNSEDPYLNSSHADHNRRVEEVNRLFKIAYSS